MSSVTTITPDAPLTLTDSAVEHARKQLAKHGATALRVATKESGCNGYMYDVSYAEHSDNINVDDVVLKFGDLTVLVARLSLPVIQGLCIDYVTEGLNSQLKFSNPNADALCGCGESFSVASNSE